MSGYVTALGECYVCRRFFSFNPLRVPSMVVEGTREPVCRACVEVLNTKRAARGLSLFTVMPDAYAAASEEELA